MTRFLVSAPIINPDTTGILYDGLSTDGSGSGNLTVSSTLTIPSGAKISLGAGASSSYASGASLAVASGANLSLANGATLSLASGAVTAYASGAVSSIATNASLSLASGAVEVVANGASLSLASGAVLAGAAGATASLASGATLNAGGQIAFGGPGTTSVSVATASGTTVPISQAVVRVSNTAASTSGSCTLAAGAVDGQCVTIINEGGANFVVTGNMKANQTLSASSAMDLVWISTDTAWWRVN